MKYFFLAFIFLSTNISADSLVERAEKDEVSWVEKDDPDMLKAYEKARASLPSFFKKYKSSIVRPDFFLKVGVRDGDDVEYFWVGGFRIEGANTFTGEINNHPRLVKNVKIGETIKFSKADIFDWMYMEDGKMKGNFTACVIMKQEPEDQQEEFKKTYGLECD